MKDKIMKQFVSLIIVILSIQSCAPKSTIDLSNPSDFVRTDEPVIIQRSWLESVFSQDVSGKFPLMLTMDGDTIASQTDDLDGDGKWDELFMLVNLMPLEKVKLKVVLADSSERPDFNKRAGFRFAGVVEYLKKYKELTQAERLKTIATEISTATFQMEGPGWENDRIAFRNYYDARNGIDIFGKLTSKMVIDSIGINGNYHNMLWWGMDILKVGNSLGAGALAFYADDSLYRLDLPERGGFQPVANGPLRSIFRLTFHYWKVNHSSLDVIHEISTWGGFYGYQSKVTLTGNNNAGNLVTGIVNMQSDTLYTNTDNRCFIIMYTHDNQSYNAEKLGLGLILPAAQFSGYAIAPTEGNGIIQTYLAKFKTEESKPLTFRIYAGWEKSNPEFAGIEYFGRYLESEAQRWAKPIIIRAE